MKDAPRPALAPISRVYTPWAEPPAVLEARTVGREDVLDLITSGIARVFRGEHPLPLYLFGSPGVGKSHLVSLGVAQAQEALVSSGLRVQVVSEAIPPPDSADALWARMVPSRGWLPWIRWNQAPHPESSPRGVVFVEGFDRHLAALGARGRKRLRALLQEHPGVWLIGAGSRLTDAFVGKDEAFYAWFQVVPLSTLTDVEASALLEREASEEARSHPRWGTRREALVTLAGGNPRALVALADAISALLGEEIARVLVHVLDAFEPQYQLRVRNLAANEQRLVSLLAAAPRELGPTDAAKVLGGQPSTWSTVAHRLADDGVLTIRQEGRSSWYRITEPLLRYWLGYRDTPPDQARASWLSELLERVLGPDDDGRPPACDPLLERHLLSAPMAPDDPALPGLLWGALVHQHRSAAARLLGLLEQAYAPLLPGCPWPWRLLALDVEALGRIAARFARREVIAWVGALVEVQEATFQALVTRLSAAPPQPPPRSQMSSYELALGRLALAAPDWYAALREALGAAWIDAFARVDVLVDQLAEADRGPLHPELARIREALVSTERM